MKSRGFALPARPQAYSVEGDTLAAETGRLVLVRHLRAPTTPRDGVFLLFPALPRPYELLRVDYTHIAVMLADEQLGGIAPRGEGFVGACTGPGLLIALVDSLFLYPWPAEGPEYERMLKASKKAGGSFVREHGGLGAVFKTGEIHQRWTLSKVRCDAKGQLLGALVELVVKDEMDDELSDVA